MKYAIYISILLLIPALCGAQVNNIVSTTGIAYTNGAPTYEPGSRGSMVAIDTVTGDWYYSIGRSSASWIKLGDRVQTIAGCSAPAYTPAKHQSQLVVNSCATPELYLNTTGSTWVCLNCASSGATNLSWTQLTDSTYQLNSSTGSDVILKVSGGATASLSGSTLTLSAGGGGAGTVTTNTTLSGDGSVGDPLSIAQQSASTSELLMWTGATWEPSWGNPYTFVTSGATITSAVNEILVGTISADITIGLPACNSGLDGKHFKIVRNGTDAFHVKIDPSGGEQFYDGTSEKVQYGKLSIDCTCRFSGGSGVWFYDNF
jgi:hypothetical protein